MLPKIQIKLVSVLIIITSFLLLSCGGGGGGGGTGGGTKPTPDASETKQQKIQKELVKSEWSLAASGLGTIKRDNVDLTDSFKDFKITFFKDGTYTSSGGKDLWEDKPNKTGKWAWVDSDTSTKIKINNVTVTIKVSDSSMELGFTLPKGSKAIGARTLGVGGSFSIRLGR